MKRWETRYVICRMVPTHVPTQAPTSRTIMSNFELPGDPTVDAESLTATVTAGVSSEFAEVEWSSLGRRLRDTLDTIREAVFQLDAHRRVEFLNAAWGDITGHCISESIGQPVESFFWSEDQDRVRTLLQRILDNESETEEAELRLCRFDGTFVWVELRARVIKDDLGHVLGLSGTMMNITDRRHAEMRLRESETLFRTAFDLSPNGIAIYAVDKKFTQTNVAMAELFGYTAGQLMTMDLYALLNPDDISQARKAVRRAQSGKPIRGVELRGMTRDGRSIWIELAASLLSANPTEPAIVLLQLQDLSERKQAETELQAQNQVLFHAKGMLEAQKDELDQQAEQLRLARQLAEDANRAKTEFLANMSHEIRTPMTSILGFSELLLDTTQSEAQRLDCVNTIRRSGKHLLGIVDDILDIAKIESGRLKLEFADVSLHEIVDEVVSLMRVGAQEKQLDFRYEFAGPTPRTIRSDAVRLRQILLNLIGNSIKFTSSGAVTVTVDMSRPSVVSGRRYLRLIVNDTGMGMSAEQLGRLFQPFEQGDISHTRRFGGTGLGLVITRRLVDMLGGSMEVTSEVGVGTTFVVTLDVETNDVAVDTPAPRMELPKRGPEEMPSFNGSILLAEDGKDNQRLIAFILRRCGLDVTIVDNGQLAIEAIDASVRNCKPFDLVLMDMQMPVKDGYTAVSELREAGARLPIVALTAHAMTGDRDRCLAAGCSDYLTKPLDRRALAKVLSRYLQGSTAGASVGSVPFDAPLISRYVADPAMKEILAQYVRELPVIVRQAENLLAASEFKALQKLMHELKGSAGGYGFDEVTALASASEASIRLGADSRFIHESVAQVIKLIRRIEGYVEMQEAA